MRALFLVTETCWSASARAFVLAARGLAARGHGVALACEPECAVHVHAAEANVAVVSLEPDRSPAGNAWQLRRALQDGDFGTVFVHTEAELLMATSAMRLGRIRGAVIRRVPPFASASLGRRARLATRIAPTGFLFSTEHDRAAADASRLRIPSVVAPPAVDLSMHDAVVEATKASLGAPPEGRLIVCVYDGGHTHRVYTAMRTVSLLGSRHPDLHLAIVGRGRLDELRMHGASLGVTRMVTYLGDRKDELSVIRAADIGWVAAGGDAAAFAALDFMAFRKPIIGERDPLTEFFVADGIGGVLLPRADPTTTAASVASFLARKELRVQMGNAGRARLQREFPYDAIVRGFEQALAAAAGPVGQAVG